LDYLSEKNLLEVKVSGLRNRYQRIKSPETTDALATDLHQRALQRENSEIKRLQQVLELTHHQSCQVNFWQLTLVIRGINLAVIALGVWKVKQPKISSIQPLPLMKESGNKH